MPGMSISEPTISSTVHGNPIKGDPAEASTDAATMAAEYDEMARTYDKDFEDTLGWNPTKFFAPLIEKNCPKSSSILDVGCGTGHLIAGLKAAGFNGKLDGFDVSPEMILVSKEKQVFNKLYVHDLYKKIPCMDGEYDVVMTTAALLFVEKKGLISELARCVKPGGHLLVASRQDRLKEFGYIDEIKELIYNGKLDVVHWTKEALAGKRDVYLENEGFHYVIFMAQVPGEVAEPALKKTKTA